MKEELKNLKPILQLIRALTYSISLTFILIVLINANYLRQENLYGIIAFFGVILGALEAYFTSKYLRINFKQKNKNKDYELTHHLVNHSFYPVLAYFSLCLFLLVETNLLLSYILIGLNFLMTCLYFYFLPYHILFDHKDHSHSKYSAIKIDFITFLFKFFSFYVSVLALFTFYAQSRISLTYTILSTFILSFLYLFFHLFRKKNYNTINIFICFLFSVIFTFFSTTLITNNANINSLISTLFFYLCAAVFYHKVDGTFNYKILLEYSALGMIVAVIIFSIR